MCYRNVVEPDDGENSRQAAYNERSPRLDHHVGRCTHSHASCQRSILNVNLEMDIRQVTRRSI